MKVNDKRQWLSTHLKKKYFGIDRTTIIIDSKGKIFKYWNKVKVSGHVQEVLEISKSCP